MLNGKAVGVRALVRLNLLKVGKADCIIDVLFIAGLVDRSVNVGDVADIKAGGQRVGDLRNAVFAHSVGNEVGAGIEKDGTAHSVGPVVVVAEPPQTGLNTADDDRCVFVCLADQVAVDNDCVVRALPDDAAGRVGVLMAALLGNRIVVDHGVHVAGRDQKAKPWLAVFRNARGIAPIGLADERDAITARLQQAADNCGAKARMVHVRVAADVDEVGLCDAFRYEILFGKW